MRAIRTGPVARSRSLSRKLLATTSFDAALADIRRIRASGAQAVVDVLASRFERYSWVGIYAVDGDDLVLTAWRGPAATEHVRIPIGQGICGAAAASGVTEIVDDVNEDSRYLACFASTRSEIVVPIVRHGVVVGEIDIDSDERSSFGEDDRIFLEQVASELAPLL